MEYTEYICLQCQQPFSRLRQRFKFCSRECSDLYRKGKPRVFAVPITMACEWCGEPFVTRANPGARQNFCTRSCQAYARSAQVLPRTLTPTEAAYLAAMIDGEGSVIIQDRSAARPGTTRPSVTVEVAGSSPALMAWLVATTGVGAIHARLPHTGSGGVVSRKTVQKWRILSVQAAVVLAQVAPYMIEKRGKAEEALVVLAGALAGVARRA